MRAYVVCLLGGAAGGGAAGQLTVDASWLDAPGADGGVACLGGSVDSAPVPEPGEAPVVKPAVVTTSTTFTKIIVSKPSKPKASASAVSSTLPKTADSHWIAVSAMLSLLGTALLATARRC